MGSPSQLVVCSSSADHNLRRKNNMSNHLISCLFASAARYLRLKLEKKKKKQLSHFLHFSITHTRHLFLLFGLFTRFNFNKKWTLGFVCLCHRKYS